MNVNIEYKQVGSQDLTHITREHQGAGSCFINAKSNRQVGFEHIKCVSPMTFSQKLYQSHALVIAEELEQAIEENSLERINNLFDWVLETSSI